MNNPSVISSGGGGATITVTAPLVCTVDDIALAPVGQVKGDLLFYNGTAWVRFPAGTAGQLQQTNGAGVDPSYVTVSGSRVSLSDLVASSALVGAPQVVKRFYYDPAQWLVTGKSFYWQAVLSTSNVLYAATVKFYNMTAPGYILINGSSSLTTTSLTDVSLSATTTGTVTNFNPTVAAMIEVQLYVGDASAVATLGTCEVVVR